MLSSFALWQPAGEGKRGNKQLYGYFTNHRTRVNSRARLSRGSTGEEERAEKGMASLTSTGQSHSSATNSRQWKGLRQPLKAWTAKVAVYWTEEVLVPSCPLPLPSSILPIKNDSNMFVNNMLCSWVSILLLRESSTSVMSVPHVLVQHRGTRAWWWPGEVPLQF